MDMRVECGSCKRLAEGQFQLDVAGGGVSITCTSCGCTTAAPLQAPRAPVSTIPLEKLCPKCGAPRQAGAESCKGCGILASRMQAYAEERDASVPDEVRAQWEACVAAWNDPARHDALLISVARQGCYAWTAGRYRDAALSRPHDPVAPRQLDRLRRAGEATLFATAAARPEKGRTPYVAVVGILAILLVSIVGGVMYASAKTKDASASPPPHFEVR